MIIIIIMNRKDLAEKAGTVLDRHLKTKLLRHTKQRDLILSAFLASKNHITADELFDAVKRHDPEVGYATVCRNLHLFVECGVADEIKVGKQKTRYEQKIGHEHHDHLICIKCGRFIEVRDEKIEKLQEGLAAANGFTPVRHKLEIYGICSKCE